MKLEEQFAVQIKMLKRNNFNTLAEAVEAYTAKDETDLKPGLKIGLYYLLKTALKIVKVTYLTQSKDDDAAEIDKFVSVLELNHDYLFGDATYAINKNRQTLLRKPQEMPLEDDVCKIREHSINISAMMVNNKNLIWDAHNFKTLRDLCVCRLTLFNARRRGEPSRLLIREWKDAELNVWIDKNQVEKTEDH